VTVFNIEINKKAPANFVRPLCMGAGCKRAALQGGLCRDCRTECLASTNLYLRPLGVQVESLTVNASGYVLAPRGKRWVGVHRIAMEAALGRTLAVGENVHHVNGNRADNRRENLELWVTCQPSGQRPDDLAAYARELLARYGDEEERARYGPSGAAAR
jgi:hypothetical protein